MVQEVVDLEILELVSISGVMFLCVKFWQVLGTFVIEVHLAFIMNSDVFMR